MRIYKLKFKSNEQALDFFESIKDGLIECVEVDNVENEFDIIHENEKLITTFEVFPHTIKHNFL